MGYPEALNIQYVSCNSVQALLSVSTLPAGCSEALVMSHKAIQDIEGLYIGKHTSRDWACIHHCDPIISQVIQHLQGAKVQNFQHNEAFQSFLLEKDNLLLSKVSFTEKDYVITSSNSSWFFQSNIGKLLYKVAMIRLDILDVIEH